MYHWLWSLLWIILPKGNISAGCRISTFHGRMAMMWKIMGLLVFLQEEISPWRCRMWSKIHFLAWCKTLAGFQTCYATTSRSKNASKMSPGQPKEYFHFTWSVRKQLSVVSNSVYVSLGTVKHPSYRGKDNFQWSERPFTVAACSCCLNFRLRAWMFLPGVEI